MRGRFWNGALNGPFTSKDFQLPANGLCVVLFLLVPGVFKLAFDENLEASGLGCGQMVLERGACRQNGYPRSPA